MDDVFCLIMIFFKFIHRIKIVISTCDLFFAHSIEVLSETGKVLTTMKAGDFFGEIGILNLDGLNK